MPDLLLELFSEEIPARMQAKAADDLRRMVTDKLVAEGLVYEGAKAFATPRRLALTVHGIPARQPDLKDERKGPKRRRAGRSGAGISESHRACLARAKRRSRRDPKKGDFYVALIEKPGRATLDVLAEMLPVIIRTFPWPKSMRWGERSAKPGALQWVRPLHSIVATFGLETEEPGGREVSTSTASRPARPRAAIASWRRRRSQRAPLRGLRGQAAGRQGRARSAAPQGHHSRRRQDSWRSRRASNWSRTRCCSTRSSGLVEWPVVLMGSFDEEFLSIPGEVIRATIRNNQKCFVVRDPKTGKLRQQVHPDRQHRGHRRRRGDHRRQRARDPRAAVATRSSSTRPI